MNILTEIIKMDIHELKALKMAINTFIENKLTSAINEIKVGDKIKVNHKKVAGMTFTVVKINRKKIRVRNMNGSGTYNVPMALIEKI